MSVPSWRFALALALAGGALAALPAPAQAAPNNDDFADAQVIAPVGASVTDSNADASAEEGEPDHDPQTPDWGALHSVWYSWTPSESGTVPISSCGSSFATVVAVYTGGSLATLSGPSSRTPTSNGPCPGTAWGGLDVAVTAGTTYWIAVDTWGGVSEDGSYEQTDRTTGLFHLQVGEGGDTISEAPVEVTVPRFVPRCKKSGTAPEKCPDGKLVMRRMSTVMAWLEAVRAEGGDVTLRMTPRPRNGESGQVYDYLRDRGKGGEVLDQSVKPGTSFFTTAEDVLSLKVGYFSKAEDDKILAATLKALENAGEGNKNVKSPCEFIDSDATPDQIEAKLASLLDSAYLTQRRAGELLKGFGCGYEVSEYIEAPGAPVDFVKDVTGIDRKRHLIELSVALPVRQDLLFVLREDPNLNDRGTLSLGADGRLTVSRTQLTQLTVQVVERLTGRLVSGAEVSFIGPDGRPQTKTTDGRGETWFASGLLHPARYAIVGRVARQGASMTGFRSIDVVDRGQATWVTMTGREMTWKTTEGGFYSSSQEDLDRSRSLPVVPANLGTGLSGAPVAPPEVVQGTGAYPNGDGTWTAGLVNSVTILDDTNFAVAAAPGQVDLGGGLAWQARDARAWPNPFQAVADAVCHIVTGLQRVFEQGADGPGTAYEEVSAEQRADIAETAQRLAENGASVPPSSLLSENGLGLISDNGGGLVDVADSVLVNLDGLELRDAQGNLIGQAGGNLIGQAGGNVISVGGLNLVPVSGGSLISDKGLG